MPRTKFEFMQDMLIQARNKHRKALGLCPEQPEAAQCPPEPRSSTDGQVGASFGHLCDKDKTNPMSLGERTDAE